MLPPFPPEIISRILHYVLLPSPSPSSIDRSPPFLPRRTESQTDFLFSLNSLNDSPNWAKAAGDRLWRELHVGVRMEANSIILALRQDEKRGGEKRFTARKVKVLHLEIREYKREAEKVTSSPPSSPMLALPQDEPEQPDGVTPSQIRELAELLPNLTTICIRSSAIGAWFFDQEIHQALKSFVGRTGFKHLEFDSHFLGVPNILSLCNLSPYLETLKLRNTSWNICSSPHVPVVLGTFSSLNLLASLKDLTLSHCLLSNEQFDLIFDSIASRPSVLTSLTLHEILGSPKDRNGSSVFFYSDSRISKLQRLLPYLGHFHLVLAKCSEIVEASKFSEYFGRNLRSVVLGGANLHVHSEFFTHLLKTSASNVRISSLTLFPTVSSCGLNLRELGMALQDAWTEDLQLLDLTGSYVKCWSGLMDGSKMEGELQLQERVERVNRVRRGEEGKRILILRL